MHELDRLLKDAEAQRFEGWDFRRVRGRWVSGHPPWDLPAILKSLLSKATSLLDLGTGGGEFLASLSPLPPKVWATERYPPNLDLARARLAPLGCQVIPIGDDQRIDLPTGSLDLVLARHEAFDAREVARVVKTAGTFVTQQVGPENFAELHRRFGAPGQPPYNHLNSLSAFGDEIAGAGFKIETLREARYKDSFSDVGAVVYFLRAAPWEVPGFSVSRFRPVLEAIHADIQRAGPWTLEAHRYLAVATRLA